jgi:hypothetical protein
VTDDLKEQLTKAIIDNADQPKKTSGTSQIIAGNNNFQVNGDVTISANKKTVKRINRLSEGDDNTARQKGSRSRKKVSGLVSLVIIALLAVAPLSISQTTPKEPPTPLVTYKIPLTNQVRPATFTQQTSQFFVNPGTSDFSASARCSFTKYYRPFSPNEDLEKRNI